MNEIKIAFFDIDGTVFDMDTKTVSDRIESFTRQTVKVFTTKHRYYLVKDGKIVEPVRGATLIGKGSEVLMKIDRVGRNMWMAQGMCGSASGSVPTNVGQPMIRVTDITVGGR